MFLAKDFIETAEGLVFAVVENGIEHGKVLCFLRYICTSTPLKKIDTRKANQLLSKQYSQYLYFSTAKQAHLHAVTVDKIVRHYQPRSRLKNLLKHQTLDAVETDLIQLCHLFEKQGLNLNEIGVTGSILIAAQNNNSDIDLVFYEREVFHSARGLIRQLIKQKHCQQLSEEDWKASYTKRDCELNYDEYIWHEKRKFNKVLINQRKVDLSLVCDIAQDNQIIQYKKLQAVIVKARVTEDFLAFDYPSVYLIDHPHIHSVVSYTATYTGQAKTGEWIEVSGLLEQADDESKRLVVGSSREAPGEYIKVINAQ